MLCVRVKHTSGSPQSCSAEIRMIRMRIGFESAYEDSEVRDEALRAYLLLG